MSKKNMSLPKLVKAFRNLRDKRSELKAEFEAQDKALVEQQEKIQSYLLTHCNENDVNSVKTDEGTFYRKRKVNYWCSDWESFHKFVLEHQIPEILQKRIAQKNLEEFLAEEGNEHLVPIGLQSDSTYTITVQKPRG